MGEAEGKRLRAEKINKRSPGKGASSLESDPGYTGWKW